MGGPVREVGGPREVIGDQWASGLRLTVYGLR
jgi:hypothetical protein